MGFFLEEVSKATGGRIISGGGSYCARVCLDSRRAGPGDLFLALRGERYDGHDFIPAAIEAGASAVIVDRRVKIPARIGMVLVDDTRSALADLALYHRRRHDLPVVAVTGSTGKTSTKEMIAAIGGLRHRVVKSRGNQNNEIGLPLTLLELTPEDELLVVEMGMRGPGQIARLAAIALPSIGVVTNIGLTHLELLGSIEAIAGAKGELLAALPPQGTAIVNQDDRRCAALSGLTKARRLAFGLGEEADVRAVELIMHPDGSSFSLLLPGLPPSAIHLAAPGLHYVYDALAAAAAAFALDYQQDEIAEGLSAFRQERGRGAVLQSRRGWYIVDDTYNANPASMTAALETLSKKEGPGRRIAVFADMLELGESAPAEHRKVGEAAARYGLSRLLTTGELSREIVKGALAAGLRPQDCRHYSDKAELLEELHALLQPQDIVLVKGSRGMHMEEVVENLL